MSIQTIFTCDFDGTDILDSVPKIMLATVTSAGTQEHLGHICPHCVAVLKAFARHHDLKG